MHGPHACGGQLCLQFILFATTGGRTTATHAGSHESTNQTYACSNSTLLLVLNLIILIKLINIIHVEIYVGALHAKLHLI